MGFREDADAVAALGAAVQLLERMTRRAEVIEYATRRRIPADEAIIELVNTALSGTFVEGWCEGWRSGVNDCRRAINGLPTPSVDQPSKRKGNRHAN